MNSLPDGTSSAAQATLKVRQELSRGLESAITDLRRLDARHRLREFACFGGLWFVGIVLSTIGSQLEIPIYAWLLSIGGVSSSAIALNAFVLLLHEGMHQTLSANARVNR
ncbi:MAG TPA: hypothetical protein VNT76_08635, partial [Candidatus Binatus sp.]|nr:hypothetical protein [Candidatus Binatus sp.]